MTSTLIILAAISADVNVTNCELRYGLSDQQKQSIRDRREAPKIEDQLRQLAMMQRIIPKRYAIRCGISRQGVILRERCTARQQQLRDQLAEIRWRQKNAQIAVSVAKRQSSNAQKATFARRTLDAQRTR